MFGSAIFSVGNLLGQMSGNQPRPEELQAYQQIQAVTPSSAGESRLEGLFRNLMDVIQHHTDGEGTEATDSGHTVTTPVDAAKRDDVLAQATAIFGHKLPAKVLSTFDQLTQAGYAPSVDLLLSLCDAANYDQLVYQQFVLWLQGQAESQLKLTTGLDGSQQWQFRSDAPGKNDRKPLEIRHHRPQDYASYDDFLKAVGTELAGM